MTSELLEAAKEHEARILRTGLPIWIGAEPTFTRRDSQEECWTSAVLGGDKEQKAGELVQAIARGLEVPVPKATSETAWLSVAPAPGVVEVNLAPAPDLETFARYTGAAYQAAREVGLSAERVRLNGQTADSGGGARLTLGGPTPEQSPFFVRPRILPSLLRYLNHHPSLSYAMGPECLGSASQGPRTDEGVRERFEELEVALDRLSVRGDELTPEQLWRMLGPLLVDSAGSSQRAEVNVEKLWNPRFGARGTLGLVELRSLGMPRTAERLVAVAALFRSLVARFAQEPWEQPLKDWGPELHDRWALPYYLAADLQLVLEELEDRDMGLPGLLARALRPEDPTLVEETIKGATLLVRPALEFWPLIGDRAVDPSTQRVQVALRARTGELRGRISASGWEVPLERAHSHGGWEVYVGAVRYRAWAPSAGLHPGLEPLDPLELYWERAGEVLSVSLHGGSPKGGPYADAPADAQEAQRRRAERVVVRRGGVAPAVKKLPRAEGTIALDLRRVGR